MGRNTRFLESSATAEENSYDYRVEWDDVLGDYDYETRVLEHKGPGSHDFPHDYDNAWDCFCDLRNNPNYIGVRLIKIDSDGNSWITDSK